MKGEHLLAVDIGNSHIVIGIFQNGVLAARWRLSTEPLRTADEYAVQLSSLCAIGKLVWTDLGSVIVCSVVPPALPQFITMCRAHLGVEPYVVEPVKDAVMPILYTNPAEVGSDRIVNAYAGIKEYGAPLIIVDFGTATTFCAISPAGEYLGGVIVPGLQISANAMFQRTAKLPRVHPAKTEKVIGRTTVESMESGLFYGYLDLVDGLLRRIKHEMSATFAAPRTPRVIA
ncbi:type III pantothenate kinase, partial [bacterium]|nr:type III pantothenate kinase [candidate division CSSED10-310 bacterium]